MKHGRSGSPWIWGERLHGAVQAYSYSIAKLGVQMLHDETACVNKP